MFDLGASELLLIAIVAIVVIGPKDMPLALRTAGRWIGKIRRLSSHFRSGLDAMVREAEMEEMEEKWRAQNKKIMEQDPETLPVEMEPTGALPARAAQLAAPIPAEPASVEGAETNAAPADAAPAMTPAAAAPVPSSADTTLDERMGEPAHESPASPPASGS